MLIPDLRAGCSLASSITGADVRLIKQRYPGVPVVTYVNTTAEVKAETDICCTSPTPCRWSRSARWGADRVILIPDEFLARNVAQPDRGRRSSPGRAAARCTSASPAQDIRDMRASYPGAEILAHPECPPEVLEVSDFAGSTAAMIDYVVTSKPGQVVLITECSMADNVAGERPDIEFVRPCNLCPHMKRITLREHLRGAAARLRYEVTVDPAVAERARAAVQRMIDLSH